MKFVAFLAVQAPASVFAAGSTHDQCKDMKSFYKDHTCCGNPDKHTYHQILPIKTSTNRFQVNSNNPNQCDGKKQDLPNVNCTYAIEQAIDQSGADVSVTANPTLNAGGTIPQMKQYWEVAMCPVNVHWHVGAEHRSAGEYDESFDAKGPTDSATTERRGFRCGHFDGSNSKFTAEYNWKYCTNMNVGETYEVHWPHSALGACGTSDQYQSPFYDGVFCNFESMPPAQGLANAVGVQGQIFTIINDEDYYYPDLIRGMIHEGDYGKDITYYTGSTTGTSRSNSMCSQYSPITWQVDRTCHLISASSFDKMCADMMGQKDDMSTDLHPHGARELVWANLSANNHDYDGGSHGSGRRLGDVEFVIDTMLYKA